MSLRTGVFASLLLGAAALPAWAADYYVAPLGAPTVSSPDGSKARPFGSVGAALKSGKVVGGDRVLLMDGSHGGISLYMIAFDAPVVIAAENDKKAHVEFIDIKDGGRNLIFKNLSVWPTGTTLPKTLVQTHVSSSNIVMEGLDIRSRSDASQYLSWTLEEWKAWAIAGLRLNGPNSQALNNTLTGVAIPITTSGNDTLVEGNVIDGYVADAMRGFGDRSTFRNNRTRNCFETSSNHDDGFQSWPVNKKAVTGLTLEGNTIIEWDADKTHPLRCKMQGIGLFDGFYDDLVIRNNVVMVSDYHGISVYGGRGVTIVNNTVVHTDGVAGGHPWIGIFNHKNGTPSERVTVANNLAMSYKNNTSSGFGNALVDNRTVLDPKSVFQDVGNFDVRPKPSSGFLDIANVAYAPLTDILGNARPSGAGPDLGAYEVGATGGAAPADSPTVTEPAPAPAPAPAPEDTTSGSTLGTDSSTGTGGTTTTESSGSTSSGTDTSGSTSGSTTTTTGTSGSTSTSGTTTTTTTTAPATTTTTTTTTDGRTAGKWSKPPSSLKFLRRR